MTEEEINKNAEEDDDLPLQSDEDLKRFKKVNPKKEQPMSKITTVNHTKGQKHPGKSNWPKVISKNIPVIDEENPELAKNPNIKFKKPEKIKS